MIRVQVELWLWLGKELGGDFRSPSEMRSVIDMEAEDGMTVKGIFDRLAGRYPAIAEKVFNRETRSFSSNLTVLVKCQDRIVSPFSLDDSPLKDRYQLVVSPFYAGG